MSAHEHSFKTPWQPWRQTRCVVCGRTPMEALRASIDSLTALAVEAKARQAESRKRTDALIARADRVLQRSRGAA